MQTRMQHGSMQHTRNTHHMHHACNMATCNTHATRMQHGNTQQNATRETHATWQQRATCNATTCNMPPASRSALRWFPPATRCGASLIDYTINVRRQWRQGVPGRTRCRRTRRRWCDMLGGAATWRVLCRNMVHCVAALQHGVAVALQHVAVVGQCGLQHVVSVGHARS